MTKIVTVLGARPQFIKASAVSRAIERTNLERSERIEEVIVHTGQHFDKNMSDVFFSQLGIPEPEYNLSIAGLSHGAMTGRMLEAVESVLMQERPDLVLVYGDTNSTLAGALAASKMHIPVAHVEAGLRSHNMRMPEEVNRILSDRISTWLFCPTASAVENLRKEGVEQGVVNVGDVMYDVTLYYREKARQEIALDQWGLDEKGYVLCTIHRAENTDDPERLAAILGAIHEISQNVQVVLPLHPRTRKIIADGGMAPLLNSVLVLEPLSYMDMLRLEMSAKAILTDSGGVQKEAYFHKIPCITMRDETEWIETVESGWNRLVGADMERIITAFSDLHYNATRPQDAHSPYGDGSAAEEIVKRLLFVQ